jgi:hypothetical protein
MDPKEKALFLLRQGFFFAAGEFELSDRILINDMLNQGKN